MLALKLYELEKLDFAKDSQSMNCSSNRIDNISYSQLDSHPLKIKEVNLQMGIVAFLKKSKAIDCVDMPTLLALLENNH